MSCAPFEISTFGKSVEMNVVKCFSMENSLQPKNLFAAELLVKYEYINYTLYVYIYERQNKKETKAIN